MDSNDPNEPSNEPTNEPIFSASAAASSETILSGVSRTCLRSDSCLARRAPEDARGACLTEHAAVTADLQDGKRKAFVADTGVPFGPVTGVFWDRRCLLTSRGNLSWVIAFLY